MCFWPLMNLDTMLLVSRSIVLSLGLCEPPDQMVAEFCYFHCLSVVSKCLDIPILLGTTSKPPKLQIRSPENPKRSPKSMKSNKSKTSKTSRTKKHPKNPRHSKDPQCSWTFFIWIFGFFGFFGFFGILMFWTICLVCVQQLFSPEPSTVQL